jgi:molecular chaperone GrpE
VTSVDKRKTGKDQVSTDSHEQITEYEDIGNEEEMNGEGLKETGSPETGQNTEEIQAVNDKYVRLYAEFENYKKRVRKDKADLVKYGNESLLYELLPVVDNLEMALQHSSDDVSSGLVQGVEITLKELKRVLEKFGLTEIEAEGKPFDPAVHHAMSHVERDDIDENTVIEEYRKGYKLQDKVLRPSFVAVSKKPEEGGPDENPQEIKIQKITEEED